MNNIIMDYQLTIPAILRRAEQFFGHKEVVTRLPNKPAFRYQYRDMVRRSKKLAVALSKLGVEPGDRVATFCWNHHQHLEAYLAIPSLGAVVHTLNPRLFVEDLVYIANHAEDKVFLVDDVTLPIFESFCDRIQCDKVIVIPTEEEVPSGMLNYEDLVEEADESRFEYPDIHESAPAAMCYTSGTTGMPKGVVYSHRAVGLHSMAAAMVDVMGICEADVLLPVVPMFHANAWGLPFTALLVGCKQVLPGRDVSAPRVVELIESEKVTVTAGVPTVWLGVLQHLNENPGAYDISSLQSALVGGAAVPLSLLRDFQEGYGVAIRQLWGMTEMCPIGTISNLPSDLVDAPKEEQYAYRSKQGVPAPFIEIRARGEEGVLPWDGQCAGELEVRGPWVAGSYHNSPESNVQFTDDGWFRTGDIVSIDGRGCIQIQDRAKDVIKSGGEWISSVALENALMGHPCVAEAAVFAVAHARWQERPMAAVVLKNGQTATEKELTDFLAPQFAKWWLPDAMVFIPEIPRTAAGKFKKTALREQFRDHLSKAEAAT